jgi:hypothetical protein
VTASSSWTRVVPRSVVPIIIICHNLLEDLSRLVRWLEDAGHECLVLLDNDALLQVPRTMAATLGTAMGFLRWKRHRALTGRDPVLMREAREQCMPLQAEATRERP